VSKAVAPRILAGYHDAIYVVLHSLLDLPPLPFRGGAHARGVGDSSSENLPDMSNI
jgi:hypothetical protein